MLTVSADSDDVLDALQAGAQGYVLKGATAEEIVDAVRALHEGRAVIAPAVAPTVLQEIRRSRDRHIRTTGGTSVSLTEREWMILQLLDQGESTTAIARTVLEVTGGRPRLITRLTTSVPNESGRADLSSLFSQRCTRIDGPQP
jgi:DNA-binding NarL/FixJ family response regulator